MAREYPALVRRAYDDGHTIGTHSMTHPYRFRALSVERGNAQIDDGIAATAAALGDPDKVAPFFRFPGFGHTAAAHEHAAERGLMVWGADVPADDWHKLGPREVARRAVQRLEYKGKGILLLHDIHQRTVEALPLILEELKERGFRIVHVVPASAERPATVTAAVGLASGFAADAARWSSVAAAAELPAEKDRRGTVLAEPAVAGNDRHGQDGRPQACKTDRACRKHAGKVATVPRPTSPRPTSAKANLAKTNLAKTKPSKVADAETATVTLRPNIHSIQ